jgi:hypothetical protein
LVRFGFFPFAVVGPGHALPFSISLPLGNLNCTIEHLFAAA